MLVLPGREEQPRVTVLVLNEPADRERLLVYARVEEARASLEQAIDLSLPRDMLFMVAPAQRLLGEVMLNMGELRESEARFAQALRLLKRFKAENEIALTWVGQGRLRVEQGRRSEGLRLLERALSTFERLGTKGDPERVREHITALA